MTKDFLPIRTLSVPAHQQAWAPVVVQEEEVDESVTTDDGNRYRSDGKTPGPGAYDVDKYTSIGNKTKPMSKYGLYLNRRGPRFGLCNSEIISHDFPPAPPEDEAVKGSEDAPWNGNRARRFTWECSKVPGPPTYDRCRTSCTPLATEEGFHTWRHPFNAVMVFCWGSSVPKCYNCNNQLLPQGDYKRRGYALLCRKCYKVLYKNGNVNQKEKLIQFRYERSCEQDVHCHEHTTVGRSIVYRGPLKHVPDFYRLHPHPQRLLTQREAYLGKYY